MDMNDKIVFTDKDKEELRQLGKQLEEALGNDLSDQDKALVRDWLIKAEKGELYMDGIFGLNPMLLSFQTAVIAVTEIGLKRDGVIAILLYNNVLSGITTPEDVRKECGEGVAAIINGLVRIQDLYKKNPVIGYALTRRAAEAMLADNSPIRVMNDTWGRWVDQGTIELFRVQPAVCAQTSWDNPDESEIARSMQASDLPPAGRAWWTVRRAIGVALDALSSPRRLRGRLVQLLRRMHIVGEGA